VRISNLGYSPVITAKGTSNAIAWVVDASAYKNSSSDTSSGPAVLRAFNATNLSQELYNSSMKAGDNAPGTVKYPVPTVADGKVFVAGDYGVAVYGLGVVLPPPTISPNGGIYTNSVTVTLADATNTTIYYTLDNTPPTTNSSLYSGPFQLTGSATLNAGAFETNFYNSAAASAVFTVRPRLSFTSEGFNADGQFQLGFSGVPGSNYVLQATTNFTDWNSLSTDQAPANLFYLVDPGATNFPYRFYRVLGQ
jgi:hypothetical protein